MKFAKKTDILLVIALVVLCLLFWGISFTNKTDQRNDFSSTYAEIYHNKTLIKKVSLNTEKDYTFALDINPNVVFHVYATGGIAFEKSDCPDKVCIHSGTLSRRGQVAACLPNALVLKIVYEGDHDTEDVDIHIK